MDRLDVKVRLLVLNQSTPLNVLNEMFEKIVKADDTILALNLASNKNCDAVLLEKILKNFWGSENLKEAIKVAVLSHPNVSEKILGMLCDDVASFMRFGLYYNDKTPVSVFWKFAVSDDVSARFHCLLQLRKRGVIEQLPEEWLKEISLSSKMCSRFVSEQKG